MRWPSGGYTIVEVSMFLAISAVIFVAAQLVFQGQQGRSQFEQGMHELSSKLQQYVSETQTGTFKGSDTYTCSATPPAGPQLAAISGGQSGTNQGCIALGQAVRVIPGQTFLYDYPVLADQYDSSGNIISSYDATKLVPTVEFGSSNELISKYDTVWGKLLSSTVDSRKTDGSTSPYTSYLVGLYSGLQSGSSSNTDGSGSLLAKGYPFSNTSSDNDGVTETVIASCVSEAGGNACSNTGFLIDWKMCFASTGSKQTALMTITPSPAGINTEIAFTSCN